MSLIINGVEIILPHAKKRKAYVSYEIDVDPNLDEIFSLLVGQEEQFLSTNGIDPSWATPI